MSFSRLDSDLFTRNLHYAATFWDEHRENVRDMLDKLMGEETLERIGNHASALTMTFNHKIGWIDVEYNLNEIHKAYTNLIDEMKMNKLFLFRFMDAYFSVLIAQMDELELKAQTDLNNLTSGRSKTDPKNSPELVNLKKVFQHQKFDDKELHEFTKILLGESYDRAQAKVNFYPQLMLYFLRFLDIYDQSLEGHSVLDYLEKKHQEDNPALKAKNSREEMMKKMGSEVMTSFGKKEFWESRYETANTSTYEWYVPWSKLRGPVSRIVDPLRPFIKGKNISSASVPSILVEGCGNSTLCEDLFNEGLVNVCGIDFVQKVVEIMTKRAQKFGGETLKYEHMDTRGLRFNDQVFDVVLDKACLDCMVCTDSDAQAREYINLTLSEANRVLKSGGYYILVSSGINRERFESLGVKRFGWKVIASDVIETEGKNFNVQLIIAQKQA